jgi:PAS domain S-box-containing protein
MTNENVLYSWKEVAAYMRMGNTTVRRLEKESDLPIRRRPGAARSTVFAFASEIDAWLRAKSIMRTRSLADDEFRLVFENFPEAIVIVNNSRQYMDANRAACVLLRRNLAEIIGRKIEDLMANPKHRKEVSTLWPRFLRKGKLDKTWVVTCGDGTTITVECTACANHIPGRHFGIMRPISTSGMSPESEFAANILRDAHLKSPFEGDDDRLSGQDPLVGQSPDEKVPLG